MLALLSHMGVRIDLIAHSPGATGQTVTLQARKLLELTAPNNRVKAMRASILVLGPLIARFGAARVSMPGGCAIGSRPVDQHIKGLCALGANIRIENGYIEAHIPDAFREGANMYSTPTDSAKPVRLKGYRFIPDMITVTGTENILMAATLAEGETVIENAAQEPEVTDLARFLVAMGACIEGIGTDRLVIQGVERLHGATYTIAPDRIEAGTFLCAVAATGGELTLRNVDPTSLNVVLDKLRESGLILEVGADTIHATMHDRPRAINRGYDEMEKKLCAVGALVQRIGSKYWMLAIANKNSKWPIKMRSIVPLNARSAATTSASDSLLSIPLIGQEHADRFDPLPDFDDLLTEDMDVDEGPKLLIQKHLTLQDNMPRSSSPTSAVANNQGSQIKVKLDEK
ncbi:hypothetical protein BGZ81_005035 [Podila clonocystis]|nr:hypothetical protein BGZ81_005035 [Podila clonocystis]